MSFSAKVKRRMRIIISAYRRKGLDNDTFSILSNNCWGGAVYDVFHLPYRTPTVGLWFPAKDYLRFLGNISYYLRLEMKQINWRESNISDLLEERKRKGKYRFELDDLIIGRLDDVDIVFLHYASFREAVEKWDRRKERLDFDNLLVKFNDQNGFTPEDYETFESLPYPHKIFFTAKKGLADKPDVLYIDDANEEGSVRDDTDIASMLRGGDNSKVC